MKNRTRRFAALLALAALAIAVCAGDSFAGQTLAAAMRTGGYVILMRHASSPSKPPDASTATPITQTSSVSWMRQVDLRRWPWAKLCAS